MKIYTVILETYYDDFGGGGVEPLGSASFVSEDEAFKLFEHLKSVVREREMPRIEKYGANLDEHLIDADNYYGITEGGSMVYWGTAVRIEESETQDGVPFRKEDWAYEEPDFY